MHQSSESTALTHMYVSILHTRIFVITLLQSLQLEYGLHQATISACGRQHKPKFVILFYTYIAAL